ncbi:MFS transporter [Thermoplasmatales archaeon SW_10_69_26]|nr:MAG: MFS transporter [Thermoplasmatales archaeon SW_10_69_26]
MANDEGTLGSVRMPTVQVILASTLMGVMGVSLISPALPAIRNSLGITEAEASLILSAFTLPGILMGPVVGILADRYGRRPVLIPSLVVYGVAGGAVLLAPGLWTVVALRVVQGAAAAGLITLAITLIGDTFEGSQRNAIMGLNGAVLSIGTGIYPLVGGLLSEIDWRAPFALYLVGVPVGLLALEILEEPVIEDPVGGLSYITGALRALRGIESALLYATALGIFVLLYGGVLTTMPFLLDQDLGLSAVAIGVVLTASSAATAVSSSLNGRLARRFSNPPIIAAGVLALGLGLAGVAWAPTPTLAAIGILPFGAGMGLSMPSLDTEVSQLVPDRFRGGAMSLRTSMVRLGQTIGPPLYAGLTPVLGRRILLWISGGLAVVLGALALVLAGRTRGPSHS